MFSVAPVMYPRCCVSRYIMSNCLKVIKVVITAAGAITGRMLGMVIFQVCVQKPGPSSLALSYRLRSTLYSAPSIVDIMNGSAIQRFSTMQDMKAIVLLERKSTLPKPSAVIHLFKSPSSVLNIPTRQRSMDM